MTDTIIQLLHDTVFIHDTIFRVDTLFVANTALNSVKGSNNQLWTTFIPVLAAIVTSVATLILFVLTYRKDVKFNKEKYVAEQNKYKFEKEHSKRVEIIENIHSEIYLLVSTINDFSTYYRLVGDNLFREEMDKIYDKFENINKLCGLVSLYFDDNYITTFYEIKDKVDKVYVAFLTKDLSTEKLILINEIKELKMKLLEFSKEIINTKK